MAVSFSKEDQNQMSKWIGGYKKYKLLFKATRDGCSARVFHTKCDNKGPTVTVCYNTDHCVFGGYNPLSWNSSGSYTNHNDAFLFKLRYKGNNASEKFPVNENSKNCMYNQENYGPVFGSGYDLCVFGGTINKTGNYFKGNGDTRFGNSYSMNNKSVYDITNNNMNFLDIEVYRVQDVPGRESIPEPWRKIPDASVNVLKTELEKYTPVQGLERQFVNILLTGLVGSGKSSFFNTVNSVFRGRVTSKARSGGAEHSLTTTFRMYKIKSNGSGYPLKFRLCDTRGLEDGQGLDIVDFVSLLNGRISDGYEFHPSLSITPDSHGYNKSPTVGDKIHCIAFVIDSCSLDVFPDSLLETIKRFQQKANQRGIPQVVLLTKVDKLCPEVSEDAENIFFSDAVAEAVGKTSQLIALPRSHIFPIQNYESEIELNDKIDLPCLIALKQMMCFADDYLEDYLEETEKEKDDVSGSDVYLENFLGRTEDVHHYGFITISSIAIVFVLLLLAWKFDLN